MKVIQIKDHMKCAAVDSSSCCVLEMTSGVWMSGSSIICSIRAVAELWRLCSALHPAPRMPCDACVVWPWVFESEREVPVTTANATAAVEERKVRRQAVM